MHLKNQTVKSEQVLVIRGKQTNSLNPDYSYGLIEDIV